MLKLVSPEYHQKLFGKPQPKRELSEKLLENLRKFSLLEVSDPSPDTELPLPADLPPALELARDSSKKWQTIRDGLGRFLANVDTHPPTITKPVAGWQKLGLDGWEQTNSVKTGLFYGCDIETGKIGNVWVPICACVLTAETWYVWVNPGVFDEKNLAWLVPLFPENENSVGIAHNAGYERSFMAPQYQWDGQTGYWFCTLSMVQGLRGMSNQQLPVYLKLRSTGSAPLWVRKASMGGLATAYETIVGRTLVKGLRDEFLAGGMGFRLSCKAPEGMTKLFWKKGQELTEYTEGPVPGDFEDGEEEVGAPSYSYGNPDSETPDGYTVFELKDPEEFLVDVINYCFKDVSACVELGDALWPEFTPPKKSAAPCVHIATFAGMLLMSKERVPLSRRWLDYFSSAEKIYEQYNAEISEALVKLAVRVSQAGPENSWHKQLDWEPKGVKNTQPKWLVSFLANPTMRRIELPLLLKCTWEGKPLTLVRDGAKKSWVYESDAGEMATVPHPSDPEKNASSLISKELFPVEHFSVESGELLSCETWEPWLEELIKKAKAMVNWVSLRRRVAELQITETETGLMSIPNDIVHGTWTRRKAGKLWLVASNPKPGKIGTEAKSFIEPPVVNGVQWKLVGADFDSQELRLASLLGDAVHKMVGSTPLSVSVIAGEKKSGTDTHSVIAKVAGCSRDTAKALVYGAVYGLGLKKATQNVMVATGKGHEEGEAIAKKILGTLKGAYGYEGLGADSFAELDRMASVSQPVTPILGDPLSKAGALSTDFKTSKVNWTIQASGRNMLDLLMYFMDILLERYSVEAKHVISIHDQIYYMCPEHLQEKVAYLLAVAHTYAWVVAFERLGLDTIPKAYLVPESIDCDYRVRKTVNSDCVTLSQPEPLAPFGKSYSVGQLAQLFPNGI